MDNFVKPNSLNYEDFLKIKKKVTEQEALEKRIIEANETKYAHILQKSSYEEDDADDEIFKHFDSDYRGDVAVIRSIKLNVHDYCYKRSYIKDIVNGLKECNKSCVYYIKKDSFGDFDYAHFIPAKFYTEKFEDNKKKREEVKGVYEISDIPKNTKCVAVHKRKSYVLKDFNSTNIDYGALTTINQEEGW